MCVCVRVDTMRVAYAVAHHLPCTRVQAYQKLLHWLKNNVFWEGDLYTDTVIPREFQPAGYAPVWCHDAVLLGRLDHFSDP